MGAARPSAVSITAASSVVTKIVIIISVLVVLESHHRYLARLKQLYRLGELTRGVATTFTRTRELHLCLLYDSCTHAIKKEQKQV